jgi:hypothetical protein
VNLATRAFPFGALVQNADHKLKASSYARGQLIIERAVPTSAIPIDAVNTFAGITKVFVIERDVARAREVELGRIQNGFQQVLSGLKAGEVVATSGLGKLHDGAKVRLREAPAGNQARVASE